VGGSHVVILRALSVGVLLLTAAVLQTALFPALSLAVIRPDLLLLVTLAVALKDGPVAGLRVGFAAGVLTDLLVSQSPAGLAALVYTAIGYAIGVARPYLAPDSLTAPVLLAFVSGLLGTAAYGTLALLLGDDRVTTTLLLQASLSVALTNALLSPIVVGVVGRLSDRFPLRGPPVAE
jgi:rod shape-determining protein MreD